MNVWDLRSHTFISHNSWGYEKDSWGISYLISHNRGGYETDSCEIQYLISHNRWGYETDFCGVKRNINDSVCMHFFAKCKSVHFCRVLTFRLHFVCILVILYKPNRKVRLRMIWMVLHFVKKCTYAKSLILRLTCRRSCVRNTSFLAHLVKLLLAIGHTP